MAEYIDGIGALTKKLEAKDILERLANVPALKLNRVADYLSVDQALIPPVGNFTVSVTFKADAFGPDNGELVSADRPDSVLPGPRMVWLHPGER